VSEKQRDRRVLWSPRARQAAEEIIAREGSRAQEAIEALELFVARLPEAGFPVRGAPEFLGRPFHTDSHAYLVIYTYDAEAVECVGVRPIPYTAFDYLPEEDG
jgi:hypothetical protein